MHFLRRVARPQVAVDPVLSKNEGHSTHYWGEIVCMEESPRLHGKEVFHVVSFFSNLSLSSDLGFFWLPFECSGLLHFIDQVVFQGACHFIKGFSLLSSIFRALNHCFRPLDLKCLDKVSMFPHISRKLGCGPPSQDAIVANQGFFISGIPQISKNLIRYFRWWREKMASWVFRGYTPWNLTATLPS